MMALARTGHVWRLGDLIEGLCDLPPESESVLDLRVSGLALDSRTLIPGALFLACQGRCVHALSFADEARRRGAIAILAESTEEWPIEVMRHLEGRLGLPVIPVVGLSSRLAAIADRFHGSPSARLEVFGIAGASGKTSLGHLLAQACSAEFSCALIGSIGNGFPGDLHVGPSATSDPLTLQWTLEDLRSRGARGITLEMPSQASARSSLSAVRVSHALFTNQGRNQRVVHEEGGVQVESVRALFASPGLAWAVLNLDDSFSDEILAGLDHDVSVAAYSLRPDAHPPGRCDLWLQACSIETRPRGLRMRIQCTGDSGLEEAVLEVSLLGRFNAANLMAVLAVLRSRSGSLDRAAREIACVRSVPGRMECFGTESAPQVVVDSANTPEALERVLLNLRLHGYRRIISVFGCDGSCDRAKRARMGAIAEQLSDHIILTDDNPRHESGDAILADILAGVSAPDEVRLERQRGLAIRRAIALASTEDAVLVAGKGHEIIQDMGELKVHFSDRAQVVEALREWREGHH